MQRVRIGLTGLAVVFLFVLLAAAIFTLLGHGSLSRPTGPQSGNAAESEQPKEPLAELGVAPGNGPSQPVADTNATSRPAPAPAHAR